MPMKLATTLDHIKGIPNPTNACLVNEFYEYLREIGTSEGYQNQNLKQIINFAKYLGTQKTFYDIRTRDEIVSFLNTKTRDSYSDCEQFRI